MIHAENPLYVSIEELTEGTGCEKRAEDEKKRVSFYRNLQPTRSHSKKKMTDRKMNGVKARLSLISHRFKNQG